MLAIFLVILFVLVAFDARMLRRQNEVLYKTLFGNYPERWAFYTAFLFVAALPIYLLRRRKFKEFMKRYPPEMLAEEENSVLYSVADACGILLSWFCVVLLVSLAAEAVTLWWPGEINQLAKLLSLSLFSSVLMMALIYSLTRRYPEGFAVWVGARAETPGSFFRIVLMPVVMGGAFAFLTAVIQARRPNLPDTPLSDVLMSADSAWGILAFIGIAVLVAPLLEELIFRGYFFNVIRRFKGETVAIVAIAVTFAGLHFDQYWGDWIAIGAVTLLGFALTVVRAWSGTVVASIIMHYVYNFCVTAIPIALLLFTNVSYAKYSVFYNQLTPQEKEVLLEDSVEHHPEFIEAYNDLAWLYATENKNLEEALTLIERALAVQPENSQYVDTKAEILYRMGRVEEAIRIEEKLVAEHPRVEIFQKQLKKFKEGKN